MANVLSDETMEYVGILAKLELKDEEKESARQDMQKMLDYVDKLNELDTSKVEPMTHIFEMGNVFREDEVTNGDDRDEMLANAPEVKEGQYKVPKTVEQQEEIDMEIKDMTAVQLSAAIKEGKITVAFSI